MITTKKVTGLALAATAAALFATVALSGRDERIERDQIR
jgi:hypothetical protein